MIVGWLTLLRIVVSFRLGPVVVRPCLHCASCENRILLITRVAADEDNPHRLFAFQFRHHVQTWLRLRPEIAPACEAARQARLTPEQSFGWTNQHRKQQLNSTLRMMQKSAYEQLRSHS